MDRGLPNMQACQGTYSLPRLAEDAGCGDVAGMLARLREEAPPDVRDRRGWTPLHHAAAAGDLSAVHLLLVARADVNAAADVRSQPPRCTELPNARGEE